MLILLLARVLAECLSIKDTTACAPWSGTDLYIDSDKLSEAYGLKEGQTLDAKMWETILINTTSGGDAQMKIWKNWIQCDYKGEMFQYYRSYACLTDIFSKSAKCNKKSKQNVPICPVI